MILRMPPCCAAASPGARLWCVRARCVIISYSIGWDSCVCAMLPTGVEDTLLFGTSGDVFTSLHSYYNGEPSIFSLIAVVDSEGVDCELLQDENAFG